ncbi:MAG: carboxypeptidase-like regulatory domain-containing protein [Planctomycetaceae bacterium]|nr:carboxypeptidase-like regulatory domain-containing protein [Planctomycetaceae bacterium]
MKVLRAILPIWLTYGVLPAATWPATLPSGALSSPVAATDQPPAEDGVLTGQLLTSQGEPDHHANAFVFLVDQKSGWPIDADSGRPVSRATGFRGIDGWKHARTDAEGQFRFDQLRPGTYRLVAQSWPGLARVPSMKSADSPIMLHGTASNVRVQSGETTTAAIRALGSAALQITCEPLEGNAFVFVGLKPCQADPILGPALWSDEFLSSIVSAVHLRGGRQTIFGLPDDHAVHVRYLNYDNNPGLGGVSVTTRPLTRVTLPVYATWSNGFHRPPKRLAALVEWVRDHRDEAFALLTDGRPDDFVTRNQIRDHQKLTRFFRENSQRKADIEGLGRVRVLDIAAAERYLAILEHHERR